MLTSRNSTQSSYLCCNRTLFLGTQMEIQRYSAFPPPKVECFLLLLLIRIVEGFSLIVPQTTISFLKHPRVKKNQCILPPLSLYVCNGACQITWKQRLCFKTRLQNKQNQAHTGILAEKHKVIQSTRLRSTDCRAHIHTRVNVSHLFQLITALTQHLLAQS